MPFFAPSRLRVKGLPLQRVNYDKIAHLYDAPDRQHDVDPNLIVFLGERDDLSPASISILDVGCGTGRQVSANRSAYPEASIVGSDLFLGMLRVALSNEPGAQWTQADGSKLGFGDEGFDYITNQYSYAHIQDKQGFVAEVYRVLKPGGRFVITNIDPWSMETWIMYQFFPAAKELDHADFLSQDNLVSLLSMSGFEPVRVSAHPQIKRERLGDFLDYASQRHRASHFLAMSDDAYQEGLDRLTQAVEQQGANAVIESQSCHLTVFADKPEASW